MGSLSTFPRASTSVSRGEILATVLILDPRFGSRLECFCRRLEVVLGAAFPIAPVRIETATPERAASVVTRDEPDLVVVCDARAASISPVLAAVRGRWRTRVLGLCCDAEATPEEISTLFRSGLDELLCCPVRENNVIAIVQRLLRPLADLEAGRNPTSFRVEGLVGGSPQLQAVIAKLPPVAGCDATCLITGETGTGKELVARAIHYGSPRRTNPFVPVNCGAIPDHLFENEVFGHIRGAYTDAGSAEIGLVGVAAGGTIFLDEVDALSHAAQGKLLRFIQDGEYRPLGSPRLLRADVRILAASNRDLRGRVEERQFRDDLFHRLNVLHLELPPLRERVADIPVLARHFLERFAAQHHRGRLTLTQGAVDKLMSHRWPGNIRELEGLIQRTVILARRPAIGASDIELPPAGAVDTPAPRSLRAAKSSLIGQFERAYLIELLARHGGNISRAARAAGKERRTFQRLLQKHGVTREAFCPSG